jgi:hypothetical protein
MYRVMAVVLAGSLMAIGQAAQAQSWGVYIGNGGGYGQTRHYWGDDDRLVRSVCSGQRANSLEDRLRHEEEEDEIDPDVARRIHWEIDRLEGKQRHECEEGDWRAIREISYRFNRIGQWIDAEAHGD